MGLSGLAILPIFVEILGFSFGDEYPLLIWVNTTPTNYHFYRSLPAVTSHEDTATHNRNGRRDT